jgi:GT2 family glycosyltransferase
VTLVAAGGDEPEISVVMVTHGAWSFTRQAVDALVAHTEHTFELIIVDNASKDGTRERLLDMRDVRVIFNEQNSGFGPASNQGAALARADYLLLLNSDAFVEPGWLDPLLETIQHDSVGAVVPCFLHRDGSLQDAGTLLAKDGTTGVYGDGDDPHRLPYRFRRVLDAGCAACMLIKRGPFNVLRGFDERYAPAYYEDADMCLRLAQLGLRVVYEPRSRVTHVRYGSGTAADAAELSRRNRARFLARWGAQLLGRPHTFGFASTQAVIASRDAMASPRVLICSSRDSAHVGEVASGIMREWPPARVTWATFGWPEDASATDRWLHSGVEVLTEPDLSWLGERLFHYDVVLLDTDSDRDFAPVLEYTQPQAPRLALSNFGAPSGVFEEGALRAFAAAGIAVGPRVARLG